MRCRKVTRVKTKLATRGGHWLLGPGLQMIVFLILFTAGVTERNLPQTLLGVAGMGTAVLIGYVLKQYREIIRLQDECIELQARRAERSGYHIG